MTFSHWRWQIIQDWTTTVLYIITPPFFWGPLPHLERVLSALNHPESTKNTKNTKSGSEHPHISASTNTSRYLVPETLYNGCWMIPNLYLGKCLEITISTHQKIAGSRVSRNQNGGRTYNDGTQQLLVFLLKKWSALGVWNAGRNHWRKHPPCSAEQLLHLQGFRCFGFLPFHLFLLDVA